MESILMSFVVVLVFYVILLVVSSLYYYDYMVGKWGKIHLVFYLISMLVIMGGLFILSSFLLKGVRFYMESRIAFIGNIVFYTLLYVPIIAYTIRERRKFRCQKEELIKVDELEYVVCYSDVVNAWYNSKTKKYYVSYKLYKALSPSERLAVLYHEEGHAKNKFINNLSLIVSFAWYFVVASIGLFIVLIWFESASALAFLAMSVLLVPIIPSVTVIAMTWSWINEHESDMNAKRKAGLNNAIQALIKTYAYILLDGEGLLDYIETVKFHKNVVKDSFSFIDVLWTLAKYSWDVPLWFVDLIRRPMYITHPPLRFRIAKLCAK